MSTKVYGASDDLVEFEGDFSGEFGHYGSDEGPGVLVVMSDGTLLRVQYGKNSKAIWKIELLRKGPLFEGIEPCLSEDSGPHSDVAKFKDGIKWVYAASEWEEVQ